LNNDTLSTQASSQADVVLPNSQSATRRAGRSDFLTIDPFGLVSRSASNTSDGHTIRVPHFQTVFEPSAAKAFPDPKSNDVADGTPRWFNYVNRRLSEFENYAEPALDDDDAYPRPPSSTILEAWKVAHGLFDAATPTPSVVPAEEGGVEFAWHKYSWDLVISVLTEETSVWVRNRVGGENWCFPLSERSDKVREVLKELSL
jgi:hypothetical protein